MILIRPETAADGIYVRNIHQLAFGRPNEADLVDALRRTPDYPPGLSLVAVSTKPAGEVVVEHILFSTIRVGETTALSLAPMAVLPSHQRRGVGSALVREGLSVCARAGHHLVVVLGHPEFYPRFGFEPAGKYGIMAPFEVPDEAFLVWAATPIALQGVQGSVRYPAAFDAV